MRNHHTAEAGALQRVWAEPHPASYAQRSLWYTYQLDPRSYAYNTAFVARIDSPVDAAVLREAWQRLQDRHGSLRTRFAELDGEVVQQEATGATFDFAVVDASAWSEPELERRVQESHRQPFVLEEGRVARVRLFTQAPDRHVLLFSAHHIVIDAWSQWRLLDELQTAVAGASSPSELLVQKTGAGSPSHTYIDYTRWQAEHVATRGERARAYWRQQLAGELPVLVLPTDRPRPATRTLNGAAERFSVPAETERLVRDFAQRTNVSVYITVLSAFAVLLRRYSGQEELVIGSPAANRTRKEFANTVGCFIDMLPWRIDLTGNPSFRELVDRVRRTVFSGLLQQTYPFGRMLADLELRRDPRFSPVYQVSMVWDQPPEQFAPLLLGDANARVKWGEWELRPFPLGQQEGQNDLMLLMLDGGQSLNGCVAFNTDLFERSTIQRFVGHLQTLLENGVRDPAQPIGQIELLTASEREGLLDLRSERPPHRYLSAHREIEQRAAETPDAVAVKLGDARLTYAELNARANQLARHLQSLGVGPESIVAVCLPRSLEMIVGVLGVLKSGGAYVPLEPDWPAARQAFILDETQTRVVLTLGETERVDGQERRSYVRLDGPEIAVQSTDNLPETATPEQLAYVIYTSGSTGKPKGVAIEHLALATHCREMRAYYGLTPRDHVLQFAAISFDPSVEQIFCTLTAGATLVLRDDDVWSAEEFVARVEKHRITMCELPAAYWRRLVEALGGDDGSRSHLAPRDVPRQRWSETGTSRGARWLHRAPLLESLRLVLVSGEQMPVDAVERWRRLPLEHVTLLNSYGPTETTITATSYEVPRSGTNAGTTIPIGRPHGDRRAYVLDPFRQPVPIGVPGELYLSSPTTLARGYLHRPEATAEKFLPDPFRGLSRMYRTGDLCRWRADGELEFLGRADFQVKIRGFRVEPEEVEQVLQSLDGVREAVVVAREDADGNKQLVAYVVAPEEIVGTLRPELSRRLPPFMVPAAIVRLEQMPLTTSGKLDRQQLPEPDVAAAERVCVPPRNAVEAALCDIWRDVLRLPSVGIDDNYFEVGGDSIQSIQIIARANRAGIKLTSRQVFQHPTIAELAAVAGSPARESSVLTSSVRSLTSSATADAYPLSPMQQGMLFESLRNPQAGAYIGQLTVEFTGPLQVDAFRRAWEQVQRRQSVLRTTLAWRDGPMRQIVHAELPLRFAVGDGDPEVTLAARRAAGFDFEHGPLWCVDVFRRDANHWTCTFTGHHVIGDGWSFPLLLNETLQAYEATVAISLREMSQLPTATAEAHLAERDGYAPEYRDYIEWLSRQDQTAAEAYWREQLSGIEAATRLEIAEPDGSRRAASSDVVVHLTADETARMRDFARQQRLTLNTLIQGAWAVLLSRYSGDEDVVFGVTSSGRPAELPRVDEMIGLFINTLPTRVRVPADEPLGDWLRRLQDQQATQRQFEYCSLVDIQRWSDVPAGSPLFETLLVVENFPAVLDRGSSELQVTSIRAREQTSFPLAIAVAPGTALRIEAQFDPARFAEPAIERLVTHLVTLLNGFAARPAARLRDVPMLPERETQELCAVGRAPRSQAPAWERTERESPASPSAGGSRPDSAFPGRAWERAVEQTPDAIAVGSLTYAELNRRANQLARHLQSRGVGPESLVAVCLERSPEMLVGVLGIAKAGGAYVPLDPSYPAERLAALWRDFSGATSIAVTQRALLERLALPREQVVCLDDDEPLLRQQPTTNLPSLVQPEHAAYVIYTSGSTGQPKGVVVPHGAMAAHCLAVRERYAITAADRVLAFTSLSFDPAVEQLFVPLLSGATIVLSGATIWSVEEFFSQVATHRLSVCDVPPAYWRRLLDAMTTEQAGQLASVRLFILGGEELPPDAIVRWQELRRQYPVLRPIRVLNAYGPTEATVTATLHEVDLDRPVPPRIPIGRPVGGRRLYVVDRLGGLCPDGVAGELFIGGDELARGYLNRPEQTAAAFTADPFGEPGARWYRTGDRCRWLPDGNLEFLGRIDQQVKLRGFRIELGEIESALAQQPEVRAAAVVVQGTGNDRRLVAYVVAARSDAIDARGLRESLRQRLPEYMVPAAVVVLESLPLNRSGKIDRRELSARPLTADAPVVRTAPETPLETTIASLWRKVLNVESVGVDDNFFDLGGHSLLVVQLQGELQTWLGHPASVPAANPNLVREVSIVDLFNYPTIRSLARHLGGQSPREDRIEQAHDRAALQKRALQRRRELHGKGARS